MQAIVVSPSSLPNAHAEIFPSSTFFTQNAIAGQLPTPAEVRAQGISQNHSRLGDWNPPPAVFSELNLLVKYGGAASIAEGQCLWMIRSYLGDAVPVPEVYGWCREGDESFIYMELIRGCTLDQRWDRLSTIEKESLCEQLRPMLGALHTLRQDPAQNFVGKLLCISIIQHICPFIHLTSHLSRKPCGWTTAGHNLSKQNSGTFLRCLHVQRLLRATKLE